MQAKNLLTASAIALLIGTSAFAQTADDTATDDADTSADQAGADDDAANDGTEPDAEDLDTSDDGDATGAEEGADDGLNSDQTSGDAEETAGVPGGEIENAEDAWIAQVDTAILSAVGVNEIEDLIGQQVATADGTIIGTIDRFELIADRPYAIIGLSDGGDLALGLTDLTFEDAGLTYGGIDGSDIGDLPSLEELRVNDVVPGASSN